MVTGRMTRGFWKPSTMSVMFRFQRNLDMTGNEGSRVRSASG